MKSFIFFQERRFYFFVIYTVLIFFWLVYETSFLLLNFAWLHKIENYIAIYEIFIGILSFGGFYFLYKELLLTKKEISNAIHNFPLENKKKSLFSTNHIEFQNILNNQFIDWNLTKSEIEIAILILRGFTNQQIAGIRERSLRTIETQTTSIYQKAKVAGKIEFISYFIADLLPDDD